MFYILHMVEYTDRKLEVYQHTRAFLVGVPIKLYMIT